MVTSSRRMVTVMTIALPLALPLALLNVLLDLGLLEMQHMMLKTWP